MFIFHGERKTFSAAKLSHICSVISDIVLLQNLQIKANVAVLKMYFFKLLYYYVFVLLLKMGYNIFGLFLHLSSRPLVRLSVIQSVFFTIVTRHYFKRHLSFCNKLSYRTRTWSNDEPH